MGNKVEIEELWLLLHKPAKSPVWQQDGLTVMIQPFF
jgi:hypothetical protein